MLHGISSNALPHEKLRRSIVLSRVRLSPLSGLETFPARVKNNFDTSRTSHKTRPHFRYIGQIRLPRAIAADDSDRRTGLCVPAAAWDR